MKLTPFPHRPPASARIRKLNCSINNKMILSTPNRCATWLPTQTITLNKSLNSLEPPLNPRPLLLTLLSNTTCHVSKKWTHADHLSADTLFCMVSPPIYFVAFYLTTIARVSCFLFRICRYLSYKWYLSRPGHRNLKVLNSSAESY